jgi:hypothetical protein
VVVVSTEAPLAGVTVGRRSKSWLRLLSCCGGPRYVGNRPRFRGWYRLQCRAAVVVVVVVASVCSGRNVRVVHSSSFLTSTPLRLSLTMQGVGTGHVGLVGGCAIYGTDVSLGDAESGEQTGQGDMLVQGYRCHFCWAAGR